MDCVKCTVGPFWVNPFAVKVCVRRNDSNNYPSCALLSTLKHTLLSVGNSAVEKCLITSTVIILTICCDFVLPCYYRMRTGRNNFVNFPRLLWRGFYCAVCLWKNYIISLCRFISLLGKGGGGGILSHWAWWIYACFFLNNVTIWCEWLLFSIYTGCCFALQNAECQYLELLQDATMKEDSFVQNWICESCSQEG